REAGYTTACIGKWHLGYEAKFSPLRLGFDRFFGVMGGSADYFLHQEEDGRPVLREGDQEVKREGYLTHLLADEAGRYLRGAGAKPFFLYLAFTTPHAPYQGPKDATGKLLPAQDWSKGTRARYVEMVEDLDSQVGRVLAALRETKWADNTVVVFA